MPNKAHDLFLLMLTLSGMKEEKRIFGFFCEAMSGMWPSLSFVHGRKDPGQGLAVDVSGVEPAWLTVQGPMADLDDEDQALIHNSVQLLKVLLDRVRQEKLLSSRGHKLESEVARRTAELSQANDQLSREIEERKHLEKARAEDLEEIKTQRDFLESLIANAPVVVGVVEGPDHRFVRANPAYETLVPQEVRPMAGRTLREVFPEVADEVAGLFDSIYRTGQAVSLREFPVPIGDRLTWWNAEYLPLLSPKGRVARILVIGNEITEAAAARKQAEAEAAKFQAVIDRMAEGLIMACPGGAIMDLNPAGRKILGYKEAGLGPAHVREYQDILELRGLNGRIIPLEEWPLARALRGETFAGYELSLRRKGSGRTREVSCSGAPVRDRNGRINFAFVSFEDITLRKRADEEIKRQTALLTGLIDSVPDIIFIKDPDGLYLECNPACQALMGRKKAEIIGHNDYDLFPKKWADFFRDQDRQVLRSGQLGHAEEELSYPDGRKVILDTLKAPLVDGEGRLLGMVGVGRDMTARKELEEDLVRAKEGAEQASVAKTMFLANMSHEIRTPLNGLLGMLQLLQTTSLDAEQLEYTDVALRSGGRLTRLLSDILDLSRIEANRMVISQAEFKLEDVFSAINETFAPLARQGAAYVTAGLDGDVPGKLIGDEVRLRQILFNLVGNAMKFSSSGEVRVEVSSLPQARADQARLLFTVSDHGPGIPDDKLAVVCEAFSQADSSNTQPFQGAGLGLAISRSLSELMGGTLTIDSEVGQGTTVYLMLPFGLPQGQAGADRAGPPDEAGQARYRILLAEDDYVSQYAAKMFLETAGHTVTRVSEGRAALAALNREQFDLVLMDVQMPILNGLEAARLIRADTSGSFDAKIPIIAVTAYAMAGDRERFLAEGLDGYLAKPLDLAELLKTVDQVMTGKRAA